MAVMAFEIPRSPEEVVILHGWGGLLNAAAEAVQGPPTAAGRGPVDLARNVL